MILVFFLLKWTLKALNWVFRDLPLEETEDEWTTRQMW